jgi:predicted RNase H-like HicB family nuclease
MSCDNVFIDREKRPARSIVKIRDVIKMLEDDGWSMVRQPRLAQTFQARVEARTRHGRREARGRSGARNAEQCLEAGRAEAMKYLIVIERTSTGYSAYSPDLPGCIATASTQDELQREMKEAIAFHLDGLRQEGMAIPEPQSSSSYVDVPV